MGVAEYSFEITPRIETPVATQAREDISFMAGYDIGEVSARRVYKINGEFSPDDLNRIAGELLCDPVTETCCREEPGERGLSLTVAYRPGVLDGEAMVLLEALKIMNIYGAVSAASLRKYVFKPSAPQHIIEKYAPLTLFNEIIESGMFSEYEPVS